MEESVRQPFPHFMRCLYRVPSPPLDRLISALWFYESERKPHAFERVLPTGVAQLVINLKEDQTRVYRPGAVRSCVVSPGAVVSGVRSRFCIIDTAEQKCVLGAVFRPGGTVPFLRMPASELRDADVPLCVLWGRSSSELLREQLLDAPDPRRRLDILESALAERCSADGLFPIISFALNQFAVHSHDAKIAGVIDQTGLSPKRFIEKFKGAVGISPKRYCRILRFQQALSHAESGHSLNWTRIAADCGYFDQAHFIHDFRSFAGETPTAYQAARTEFRNHGKFIQSETVSAVR